MRSKDLRQKSDPASHPASDENRTVVIGLGNPYLGDDGVGVLVIRQLAGSLAGRQEVTVIELPVGGLRLMEAMVGCRRALRSSG